MMKVSAGRSVIEPSDPATRRLIRRRDQLDAKYSAFMDDILQNPLPIIMHACIVIAERTIRPGLRDRRARRFGLR